MAGLRDLFQYGEAAGGALDFDQIYVYNVNKYSQDNGGQCCLFTVPSGANWMAIEMWGGGGGSSGACCCFAGRPGGSGSYSRKIITGLSGGEQFTVCAAGSTVCSQCHCFGCNGYPSFVRCNGGIVVACAQGGIQGQGVCYHQVGCARQGYSTCTCGTTCGTLCMPGQRGGSKGTGQCAGGFHQYIPSAPFVPGGSRGSRDACSGVCHGCTQGGCSQWPGQGGASAVSHTSTIYCGQPGVGGLVTIYYPIVPA